VFRRYYTQSAMILFPADTYTSGVEAAAIVPKRLVQCGHISLDRDVLHFDPMAALEFLTSSKARMVMSGVRNMAIISQNWNAVSIVQVKFGTLGFPNLKNLSVVLEEVMQLQWQHVTIPQGSAPCTFSVVSCPASANSSITNRTTLNFELATIARTIFDEVITFDGGIETAFATDTSGMCAWSFVAVQESFLHARAAQLLFQEISSSQEKLEKLLGEAAQLLNERALLLSKYEVNCWVHYNIPKLLKTLVAVQAGIVIYVAYCTVVSLLYHQELILV
jgi:hypothetical protein